MCPSTMLFTAVGSLASLSLWKRSDSQQVVPRDNWATPGCVTDLCGQRGCRAIGRKILSNHTTAFFIPFTWQFMPLTFLCSCFLPIPHASLAAVNVLSCWARQGTRTCLCCSDRQRLGWGTSVLWALCEWSVIAHLGAGKAGLHTAACL